MVESEPTSSGQGPLCIVSQQMQLQKMPNCRPTAAWPWASEASAVFVCLCPLLTWERAIFGPCVLQTDQQSRKCLFSQAQLGWGSGPLSPVFGARGSGFQPTSRLQPAVSHLRAGAGRRHVPSGPGHGRADGIFTKAAAERRSSTGHTGLLPVTEVPPTPQVSADFVPQSHPGLAGGSRALPDSRVLASKSGKIHTMDLPGDIMGVPVGCQAPLSAGGPQLSSSGPGLVSPAAPLPVPSASPDRAHGARG